MYYINTDKGYSLLEITVVISIFLVLMIIGSDYIIKGFKSIQFAYEMETAVSNARRVINEIIKEVRKSNTSDCGDYLLEQVDPQSFIFYSDIDADGLMEKVRYFLDSGAFKKGVIKPSGSPLAYLSGNEIVTVQTNYINNQAEPIFYYLDTNNNIIAAPASHKSDIRLVRISLKINVTPEIAPNDYYVDTDIQIRNLKDNL